MSLSRIFLALLFAFPFCLQAQSPCGTDALYSPENPQTRAYYEARILSEQTLNAAMGANKNDADETIYTIPVVVHVIHTNGVEKISEAQCASQIIALNRDFRRQPGTVGFGAGVDMGIEFSLATKDPNGNPTTGVTYTQSTLTNHKMDSEETDLKALIQWPPEKYLNIWLVKDIIGQVASGGSVLGYARYPLPNGAFSNIDGVVIEYDSWGITGTLKNSTMFGRVATHEVGHWLALAHPFDGGCGSGCQNSGDNVCDTPPVADPNFSLPPRINSCTNDNGIDRPDNTRLYMDYASDLNKDAFSLGQKKRSRSALTNAAYLQRNGLWKESNLIATGTGKYQLPVADFYVDNRFPCVGSGVMFTDYGYNQPSGWQWEFPGGTPATSTEANPIVVYSAPGVYSVTLTLTNLTGASQPKTHEGLITVSDTLVSMPFFEGFEDNAFPPAGWKIDNQDEAIFNNKTTWTQVKFTGGFDSSAHCARLRHYQYNGYGQLDGLISPSIDLSADTVAKIAFNIAYTPLDELVPALYRFTDTLSVYASEDCGANWVRLYQKGGNDLASVFGNFELFSQPQSTDWMRDSANLADFAGKNNVQIKFETTNGFGNNLYLDDIRVTAEKVETEDSVISRANALKSNWFTLSPNPTNGLCRCHFRLDSPAPVTVQVYNVTGRLVQNLPPAAMQSGDQQLELDLNALPAGLYAVRLTANGQSLQKMVARE